MIDRRLTEPGLAIKVADLVVVFQAHRPAQATCPACRHRYTTAEPHCPSYLLARKLLLKRRHENRKATMVIAHELESTKDTRVLPDPEPVPPAAVDVELFEIAPHQRRAKVRRARATKAVS